MLKELINYSRWLRKDFPEIFEGNLSEGLHILIDIDDEGNFPDNSYKSFFVEKDTQLSEILIEIKKREIISEALGDNKGIIDKVIFSNNPYSIFFKLYFSNSNTKEKVFNKDKFSNFVKKSLEDFKENKSDYGSIKTELLNLFVKERLLNSFNNEKEGFHVYLNKIEKEYFDVCEESIERMFIKRILEYVKNDLFKNILNDENLISMFLKEKSNKLEFDSLYFDKFIKINFRVPFSILHRASIRYYSKNVFNVSKYNIRFEESSEEYGLSNFFNKAAEDKKLFNLHRSSYYKSNQLIESNDAMLLSEFLNATHYLPNILPVFIDKEELNFKVIKLFKNSDNKRGYKEIIADIAKNNEEDLHNYYLINFTKKEIRDLDFVSSFKYKQKIQWNSELSGLFLKNFDLKVEQNIFFVEQLFYDEFFYKKLSYFGSIKKTETTPDFLINNYYKYNKLFYDAFYKSRLYLITADIFKDICMPVIRHEISHDETEIKQGKIYSKFENRIIKKLLIYIQLNQLFDKEEKNLGGIEMASKLPEYYQNCVNLLTGKIDHYQSDEDFAFGTGQLIRYLLEQSESSNKNHSMFTPFLQKLVKFDVFITQINRAMMTYGHKIKMSYNTVDKLMSNTTSYKLENGKSLKDLETMLICGYFAKYAVNEAIKIIDEEKKQKNGGRDE